MKVARVVVALFATCLSLPSWSFAEFQYTETTTITGGSIVGIMKMAGAFSKQARQANEPITTTILVQGNRMARISASYSEIIDLDKETITQIDNQHKSYTVVTFQQMKQQMEDAARQARQKQSHTKQPQASENPDTKLNFHVNVRNTPNTKQVAGLNASEAILAMSMEAQDTKTGEKGNMAITNDMWMASEVPGYAEVRDFQRRYALKMGAVFNEAIGAATLASLQPGSAEGMAEMVKEMSKLKGTPVLQIMRMGTTANGQPLPAASEAPLPESNTPSARQVAKESVASSISSKLGGFGGFGRKKKSDDAPPQEEQSGTNQAPQSVVLIESKTEMTSFSRGPVDASKFDVPAGYKQVEARTAKS